MLAKELYEVFLKSFDKWNIPVEAGIFQADMKVEILNDGPVTLILNSPARKTAVKKERTDKEQEKFDREADIGSFECGYVYV